MVNILVVEDDPDVQVLIADLLDTYEWEFNIHTATTGQAAIEAALASPPKIVLLDVRLADEIDGFEVARQIRSHPTTANAKIIMLSAHDDPIDKHMGQRAGANEYLTKPVQNRILMAALQEALLE